MLDHNEFYLTLVRHGQSETNATPDMMGQLPDVPLTKLGREQAGKLRDRFIKEGEEFNFIYSSPYTRALDTAKIATSDDARIILVDEIREYSAGHWTGASRSTTLTPQVKGRMGYLEHAFLPPAGESLHQVERRASTWLENTILYNDKMVRVANELSKEGKVNNIVIFSHGMTIKCLLHYVMGFDRTFTWKVTIDNTSVTRLYFGKEGWRLLTVNDSSHLR